MLRGPEEAISMTSIRFSALHRPSMRTMWGLFSWYMISASLIISSFTSFSLSFFSTLMATSVWPLEHLKGGIRRPLSYGKMQKQCTYSKYTALIQFLFSSISSLISCEDSFLDTAKVPGAKLHFINQQLIPLDVKLLQFIRVVVWVDVRQNLVVWKRHWLWD